ncbi:carboxysome shell carbonic anhydrase [Thiothrix subterranea]|uniref:carboxysome shell carbonic anhydrase n=1 Tax=Thiothrix subterranea TaxID=2735563 RepID=UPI00192B6E16|nr:carboxysome shell carbonic anhydrase [Thiothrix subterranea]QQZ29550.1 carboxysome shell carbonic anhydrase [Thiothrix subterranea]
MNSRQAQQALRVTRQTQGKGLTPRKVTHPVTPVALRVETGTRLTPVNTAAVGSRRHPLANQHANARLAHCEESVKGRFEAIAPALQAIAGLHLGAGFSAQAQAIAEAQLGYRLPERILNDAWVSGVDMKALYAYCAFQALKLATEQFANDLRQQVEAVQDTRNFFLDCGFHAVDISPCADGRLKGLMRYILRLPLTSFTRRKAYAGALFDVETDVRHWMATELRRFREGVPTTVDAGTRYLKIAVYHTSSSSPCHEGCAAHGSNDHQAVAAALDRLNQFRQAIENSFCCGASTDILLIGVDTDTDAIRVHIPDGNGELSPQRFVDNKVLFHTTLGLSADQAGLAVHEAVEAAINQHGWGTGKGAPHDGMRRLVTNLLINNLSQMDYVMDLHNGQYTDIGHAERYISVGDGFEEVQIRNVAYYAHLHTLEEGVADMDVGIKIFKGLNVKHGLPVPVAIHYRYDAGVPGSRERTVAKAQRVAAAIRNRYAALVEQGLLLCHLSVQDTPTGSPVEVVEDVA